MARVMLDHNTSRLKMQAVSKILEFLNIVTKLVILYMRQLVSLDVFLAT